MRANICWKKLKFKNVIKDIQKGNMKEKAIKALYGSYESQDFNCAHAGNYNREWGYWITYPFDKESLYGFRIYRRNT